jgi:hypothetical protein
VNDSDQDGEMEAEDEFFASAILASRLSSYQPSFFLRVWPKFFDEVYDDDFEAMEELAKAQEAVRRLYQSGYAKDDKVS